MDMPEVLATELVGDKARLTLSMAPELDAFKGHFDEAPLVPGVVQMFWALEFCRQYLRDIPHDAVEQVEALKFQHIIRPGQQVSLNLTLQGGKLQFSYESGEFSHSSGKLVLG